MMARNLALLALAWLVACTSARVDSETIEQPASSDPYAFAMRVELPPSSPEPRHGLENFFRLSETVFSGAEPLDDRALEELAGLGIRTILSVDGKVPDHETAEALGMRYVHVPIQYSGITDGEAMAITKTFRELEAPFYVHCFHGKHRGPAAAAIGRVVVDGVSRERAAAEMRQWCGTAEKYTGLYEAISDGPIPSAQATAASDFDFPKAHVFTGQRAAMVAMTRHWDVIKAQSGTNWTLDPAHPDADAVNSAEKIADTCDQILAMDSVQLELDEYHNWLRETRDESLAVAKLVRQFRAGDAEAGETAKVTAKRIKATCTACHVAYRN